jgi:hypothetical protein
MRRLFVVLVALAVFAWVSATQAGVITSVDGDNINPSDYGIADTWNVTYNAAAYEDLTEMSTYISISGLNAVRIDATNFTVTGSSWGGASGWSTVDNNAGLFGLAAGDMTVRFDWSIVDMLGAEGGSKVAVEVSVTNNSGSNMADVLVTEFDYFQIDGGWNNVGSHYPWDTLGVQGDPANWGDPSYRGYLAWVRGTLGSYQVDSPVTTVNNIVGNALTDTPAGVYWYGGGIGPVDNLAMALAHSMGTITSGNSDKTVFVVQIPEPSTYALVVLGLAGVLAYRRRKS